MNTEQHYLLQEHDLTGDMICALSTLVEGKKYRHQNRSYKALHRRGLATEDFQVTQAGSEVYQSYCSMGKSITEQMEERRQEFDSNLSLGSLEPQTLSLEPNTYDQDLQTVIACWPKLPIELRMLIADAARRISDR